MEANHTGCCDPALFAYRIASAVFGLGFDPSAVKENAMHYSVQFFTWTPKQGVHQVGSTIEIDAVNAKLAAVSLLGLRLDETGAAKKLAVRVWNAPDDSKADCECFYYH